MPDVYVRIYGSSNSIHFSCVVPYRNSYKCTVGFLGKDCKEAANTLLRKLGSVPFGTSLPVTFDVPELREELEVVVRKLEEKRVTLILPRSDILDTEEDLPFGI